MKKYFLKLKGKYVKFDNYLFMKNSKPGQNRQEGGGQKEKEGENLI